MSLDEKIGIAGLVLTVAAWLIAPKRLFGVCKKFFWVIVPLLVILALFYFHKWGWLNWLFLPVTWPVWGLILLGFFSLAIPVTIILLIAYFEKQPSHIEPENYKTDEIFGIQWVWDFRGTKLDESELSAFCPKQNCKCRLDRDYAAMASGGYFPVGEPRFSLSCSICGFKRDFEWDWDRLKRKVFIEIERRIRTREYIQRMQQQQIAES
jgi:hypothetical protein